MKIELLGDNCRKCRLLKNNLELALRGMGATVSVEHVEEPARFAEYGLLSLPALAIDGRVRAEGQLLSSRRVAALLAREE